MPRPTPMPREKGPDTIQLTLLVTPETRDLADAIARRMSKVGIAVVTRTDVLREAVRRGLASLDAEHAEPTKGRGAKR